MDFKLIHIGKYNKPERGSQITHAVFLGLSLYGKEQGAVYYPSGKLLSRTVPGKMKLGITPAGFRVDFAYNAQRENYVIACELPGLTYNENEPFFYLHYKDSILRINPSLELPVEKALQLRGVFEKIIALKRTPLPGNIFYAEQLCCMLIGELAASTVENIPNGDGKQPLTIDLAEQLRRQLDEDERFELTLSEHCRKLGFSAGYARRVFARRFLIEPQEYRLRRRLERILYLLSTHRYCHKEIADMVGMKSVNHLHSFLKQRSGMTPGEIDKKFPV